MKKRYYIMLSIFLIIILSMTSVSAGFFDFLGQSNEANVKFSDMGITNNCSNDWYVQPNVTKTVTDNGTKLSSHLNGGVYANAPSTSLGWGETFEWTTPFTIEFDVTDWSGTPYFRITDYNHHDATKNFGQLQINKGDHVKVTSTNSGVNYFVNDQMKLSVNETFKDAQVGFRIDNSSVTYKNFKIY